VVEAAARRFGMMGAGRIVGNANEIVDAYAALVDRGVERFYTWFTDFADPRTLEAFGATVIAEFR
jgi:hypothetical protein